MRCVRYVRQPTPLFVKPHIGLEKALSAASIDQLLLLGDADVSALKQRFFLCRDFFLSGNPSTVQNRHLTLTKS